MFNFFLKKNFCDGWDNLFMLLLLNLIFIAAGVACYFGVSLSISINPLLPNLAFPIFAGLFSILIFAWGANARKIADFNTPSFSLFFRTIPAVWKTAFAFGFLFAAFLLLAGHGIVFYFHQYLASGSYVSLILGAVLAWFSIVSLIALQWFIPLYFLQEENTFQKALKKSFIIFFDNAGFSIAVFLYNLLLFAMSIVTFGIMPGITGIFLSPMNALRLRLYKYDWLEEHPEALNDRDKREEVPWGDLIAEDKESLGERKLASFIFPWK